MASTKGTILITGGTGKVGSSIAQICQASSTPYLITSRSASSATAGTAQPTVKFDWLDRTTWSNPFVTTTKASPITSIFLVSPFVFDSSPIINDFIDLARREHGVKRFVLIGATTIPPGGTWYGGSAKYLHDLGAEGEIEFAYLRATWFMDNWAEQEYLLKPLREEGRAYSASGDGKVPWVSKTDIAAVAFQALTSEKAPNGDVMILGPENLSYAECADILTEVLGKKIAHVSLTTEELAQHAAKTTGMPEGIAKVLASWDTPIRNGEEARMNDVVERMTGKKPKSFREFAQENRDVWL